VNISQGLKAGLAGGVVYGLMIGLIHLGTLEACSSAQIQYITQQLQKISPPSNSTADQLFSTDLAYFPMINGIWALVYGVIFGALFASIYSHLPGTNSKKKGMTLGIGVIVVGFFVGPASYSYRCSSDWIPLLANVAGFASGIFFGFVLGVFYDSFGRLHEEDKNKIAGPDLASTTSETSFEG